MGTGWATPLGGIAGVGVPVGVSSPTVAAAAPEAGVPFAEDGSSELARCCGAGLAMASDSCGLVGCAEDERSFGVERLLSGPLFVLM